MAKNVNVAWVLPTTRESNRPLDPADIAGVELSISADKGVNWSVYDTFPPAVANTVIPELDIGEWQVAGVVIDTAGKRGKAKIASIVVPDETAPGELLELTLSF